MSDNREAQIEINKEEFRKIGYQLIDDISSFIDTIDERPVTKNESPQQLRKLLKDDTLPETGKPAANLIAKATELLFSHSLFNGHPKFLGYITSSASPIGGLADMLAATVNPNVGAHILSPMATEIESQTIKWLCEFIGVSKDYGGILVSGGNMANFTAFLAARTAKFPKNIKEEGISSVDKVMTVYCSKTTHTWVEKAMILFGLGTNSIRWIQADASNRMEITTLEETIKKDIDNNFKPLMVIGTAGDVSTGAVDDLNGIATICKKHDLWFHVDGAYGVPAAVIPQLKYLFDGIKEADSIALDPHKWLYNPLESGCALVKNPQHLMDAYSSHPEYYKFTANDEDLTINYYEYGLQNSRGFRALKTWLTLQQIGRSGYEKLIGEDIELSKLLFELANNHSELFAVSQNLSITTFRYIPLEYMQKIKNNEVYLNNLNEELLNELQTGGEVFLSNAIIKGQYCLRTCIVNFRTTKKDIVEIIEIIVRVGRATHLKLCKKKR